jgi:hypothetical protein
MNSAQQLPPARPSFWVSSLKTFVKPSFRYHQRLKSRGLREEVGMGAELEVVMRRLEAVEKENRRLKRGASLALLGLGSLVLMGQARSGSSKTIEAERFVLKDETGNTRSYWGINPNGGVGMGFLGRSRVMLGTNPDGARIAVQDPNGKTRLSLTSKPDGSFGLDLKDDAETTRAALKVRSDGTPVLELAGKDGQDRVSVVVLPDASAGMLLTDSAGKVRGAVAAQLNGAAGIDFMDKAEKTRASLSVKPDGSPSLSLYDEKGGTLDRRPPLR